MMSLIATAVAATEELAPLFLPPLVFAAIGVTFFLLVGFMSWSFRDVANRHSNKTSNKSHGAGH
jgi:hypothetical protein